MLARLVSAVVAASMLGALPARANDFAPQIARVLEERIRPWLSDPVVVASIEAQNARTAALSDAEVEALDEQWRTETRNGGGPLIASVTSGRLSRFLRATKDRSGGLFLEILVMDGRGLNVGVSDVTSDYMQGDEDKWRRTYPLGPGAVFVDRVEYDASGRAFQSQVSATVADPETGDAIGAVTVGINVERLGHPGR